jgi:hypothetical protein
MKNLLLIASRSLLVVFCIAAVHSGTTTSQAAEGELTNEALAAVIEQLVLTEKDTFVRDGQSYLSREAATRINGASSQLKAAGKAAWPQLFAHLQDRRESTPSADVIGPHDVGQKCYYILRGQIMDFPQGYPYSKLLASHSISFRPTIDDWLKQRQDRSMDEIRYEVLGTLLDMESYANEREAVDLLSPHLEKIEARIKLASQGKLQRISPGPKVPIRSP